MVEGFGDRPAFIASQGGHQLVMEGGGSSSVCDMPAVVDGGSG